MKRKVTVQSIFWRYLIWFCCLTVALLAVCFLLFAITLGSGAVLPANYQETALESKRAEIQGNEKVTEDLIPEGSHYGVYSVDGTFLYGNLPQKNREKVWQAYQDGTGVSSWGYMKYFERGQAGEICIAVYHIKAEFTNPVLQKFLPGAPESFLIVFLIAFIVESVLLNRKFGQLIRKELEEVKKVTEKVKLKDLEFEKPVSRIIEIDDVMESLIKMKDALEVSLKQQWKQDEARRQQVRALVHDIKTPLTVIRGNAQLAMEAESAEEGREYHSYILEETDRIERYIQILQEMLRSEGQIQLREEQVNVKELAKEFANRAKALADTKRQKIEVEISLFSDYIISDRLKLFRAWENLLSNAAEYTPQGGEISVLIEERAGKLCFQIEDSGPGFTEEDIRHGREQFYQGDKSRNSQNHYGMGLFMVQSFAEHQGGTLILGNSEVKSGGKVRMEISLQRRA